MHYSETFATDVRLPIIPIMKKLTRISEGENHTFSLQIFVAPFISNKPVFLDQHNAQESQRSITLILLSYYVFLYWIEQAIAL